MLTDALVLRTWPYSESTLIVSVLTPEEGVVRVLAKGARRLKGHTAAAFDLFSRIRAKIRVRSGDGLGSIGSVELRHSWDYLRGDLKRLAFASVGIEILGALAEESPCNPRFFDEAVLYLTLLESTEAPGSLTSCLLLRLLHEAGYPPRLGEGITAGNLPERLDYDFDHGTIVARAGAGRSSRYPLARELVRVLADSFVRPPELERPPVVRSRDGRLLMRWLVRVWEDHLHRKVASAEFLEKTVLSSGRGG